ncbi:hypothetical protein AV530_016760 [Patagioenas fasciata monilis]|uniref:Uncharacterized protein n=1 Tax=Patagioenas fasciata monilis TaxID=372326 RepID=A0A1V4J3I5_PATFA|nr:hypothetical protein AV530_016760 [Patagioenas fasciata monilis]
MKPSRGRLLPKSKKLKSGGHEACSSPGGIKETDRVQSSELLLPFAPGMEEMFLSMVSPFQFSRVARDLEEPEGMCGGASCYSELNIFMHSDKH